MADGIAAHESIAHPQPVPAPPLPNLAAQSCPNTGLTSSTQIAVAGNMKSDGMTSTSMPAPSSATTAIGGTQQEESSVPTLATTPAAVSVSVPVSLNDGASSSKTPAPVGAIESASVFDVVLSSERSAHGQVCSDSVELEPNATSTTDHAEHSAQQAQESQDSTEAVERKPAKSLEAASVESTLLDVTSRMQQDTLLDISTQIVDNGWDETAAAEETQIDHDHDDHEAQDFDLDHTNVETTQLEHLPEPPASPISNTLLSTPSNSAYEDACGNGMKETKTRVPSANRISISYAGGNRRLVIDAEVVRSMRVLRQTGIIEVVMDVVKFNENELKGILVSASLF